MNITDNETDEIAKLYLEMLEEASGTRASQLNGKPLVSALTTTCMSRWYELTAKFRSRPEVYDPADSQAHDSYNIFTMHPGSDVRDDAFEAISKATMDITKELNRLFGKDVFEPRISRSEGRLETLVAYTSAKGGVFQAKGEAAEGHTVINLTMPKEEELERAFSAMTDTPHANDGMGDELGMDAEFDAPVAGDPAPDYNPDYDVAADEPRNMEEPMDPQGDPLDDLDPEEADRMFNDDDNQGRLESLNHDVMSVIYGSSTPSAQPEQLDELFGWGRKKKNGKAPAEISERDVVNFIKVQMMWARQGGMDENESYDMFLLGQLPHAFMMAGMGFEMMKINEEEFRNRINEYFDGESFDWDGDWADEDLPWNTDPEVLRVDLLKYLAKSDFSPMDSWAQAMLDEDDSMDDPEVDAVVECVDYLLEDINSVITEGLFDNKLTPIKVARAVAKRVGKDMVKVRPSRIGQNVKLFFRKADRDEIDNAIGLVIGEVPYPSTGTGNITAMENGIMVSGNNRTGQYEISTYEEDEFDPLDETVTEGFVIKYKEDDVEKESERFENENEAERQLRTNRKYKGGRIAPVAESAVVTKIRNVEDDINDVRSAGEDTLNTLTHGKRRPQRKDEKRRKERDALRNENADYEREVEREMLGKLKGLASEHEMRVPGGYVNKAIRAFYNKFKGDLHKGMINSQDLARQLDKYLVNYDELNEDAPAVSVGGATAAGSSPAVDVVKNIGKKKKGKRPMKRMSEAVAENSSGDIVKSVETLNSVLDIMDNLWPEIAPVADKAVSRLEGAAKSQQEGVGDALVKGLVRSVSWMFPKTVMQKIDKAARNLGMIGAFTGVILFALTGSTAIFHAALALHSYSPALSVLVSIVGLLALAGAGTASMSSFVGIETAIKGKVRDRLMAAAQELEDNV